MPVAVAASSQISADAGAQIADLGGNCVDAVLAATIVSLCTDPCIVSPTGGAFITVWPADGEPVVIDGSAVMPGRSHPERKLGDAMWEVVFEYHGPCRTQIGYGSVATPGDFAGLELASQRYGRLSWNELLKPAIYWAQNGFPLTGGAAEYLGFAHEAVYGWEEESRRTLHRPDGRPLQAGDTVHVRDLADSLRQIAADGSKAIYDGELGYRIVSAVEEAGGLLSDADLKAYRAKPRASLKLPFGDWQVSTNPAPSIGGPCLAGMLQMLNDQPQKEPDAETVRWLIEVQHAVLSYRAQCLDGAHGRLYDEVERMLELCSLKDTAGLREAPSTIHVSGVDNDGCACAVTSSAGYGSGAIAPGTGIWLNNILGEVDLHPRGFAGLEPGAHLASNMAPTIARRDDGAVLAIGSPGASRITTAIAQVINNFIHYGMDLETAVRYPRAHVEVLRDKPRIAWEPGLPVAEMEGFDQRPFPGHAMYFGAVQAACLTPEEGLTAVADDRRGGRVGYGG